MRYLTAVRPASSGARYEYAALRSKVQTLQPKSASSLTEVCRYIFFVAWVTLHAQTLELPRCVVIVSDLRFFFFHGASGFLISLIFAIFSNGNSLIELFLPHAAFHSTNTVRASFCYAEKNIICV